ncbi:hypothetical protein Cgig2_004073 [Carnegiea gigantea]|uniref:CTP synthase n=1 Tax=Carnegiea gigantea TaxID=171969 RepID=A0A9Q1KSY9_9CARY|nr:hypothetical protein Cgig2_004073 [Carnegiea gigantea]
MKNRGEQEHRKKMKYVLVTGGVVSGLGKGVTASSVGVLLKACGLRVTSIKIDPYLNTDAGTMSPFEHGEVFVLDDGGEVDLDLGNYERFLDIKLTRDHNITTGKVYQASYFINYVINKERKGDYLGKTVQVVPHITDAIQEWIDRVANIPVDGREGPPDVCVIELGGTIGDIESMPFIEALGQFSYRVGPGNFCLIHVSLVPVLNVVGEQPLHENVKAKLSQFCHVPGENIITLYDVPNIWHIPLLLRDQKAHEAILNVLNLSSIAKKPVLDEWTERAELCDMLHQPVRIAMVGKYTGLSDSYLSVLKALLHASVACRRKLTVDWIPASDLEDETKAENPESYRVAWDLLKGADGVLVPGGFGDRGVQGKILAAKYARENKVPYLGICLGMQTAVIEFARSVLGLKDANSEEFDPSTKNPFVVFMPEVLNAVFLSRCVIDIACIFMCLCDAVSTGIDNTYGGDHAAWFKEDIFSCQELQECKTVNPEMVPQLESAGMSFTGKDETGQRMEIIELPDHPFFIGAQFHPEYKSRPGKPSPLFVGLIAAASGQLDAVLENPSSFVHNFLKRESPSCNGPPAKKSHHDAPSSNGRANGFHKDCRNGFVNSIHKTHANGSVNGMCNGHSNGSVTGIYPEYANGMNGVYSDGIYGSSLNGIISNGNGFHH